MPSSRGPWKMECIGYWDHRNQYGIFSADGPIVATVEAADDLGEDTGDEEGMSFDEISTHNGMLMAAAPELLGGLAGAVEMLDHIKSGGHYSLGEYHDRLTAYKKTVEKARAE